MLDINHWLNEDALNRGDPDGNMYDLDRWSPKIASQLAQKEGLDELTEAHWHVIYLLRDLFRVQGRAENSRKIVHLLENNYLNEGGLRFLYELFPKGPVSQGSRLAGVPAPANSSEPSFGWAG